MATCDNCKREPGQPYQVARYTQGSDASAYYRELPRLLGHVTRFVCDRCIAAGRRRKTRWLTAGWFLVILGLVIFAITAPIGELWHNPTEYRAIGIVLLVFVTSLFMLLLLTIAERTLSHTKRGEALAKRGFERQQAREQRLTQQRMLEELKRKG